MESIRAHVAAHLAEHLALLDRLVRHPSVAAQGRGLEETASEVETQFRQAGAARVERLRLDGAPPALLAEFPGRSDRTLLFYNHYDVQPPEPLWEWTVPPFELTARDGRLYGRGVADNKGDLVSRLAALRALRETAGGLPCRALFLVEGEEEVGSVHFGGYVRAAADRLRAGGCVWEYGERDPHERLHVIAGVKGICYVELEVEATARDLHSMWGALVDGAATRLIWALAGLRGADGRILIPGFYDAVRPPRPEALEAADRAPLDDAQLRLQAGTDRLIEGRSGRAAVRAYLFEPTCTICGIDAGYTGAGMKTVLPRRARAKIDFRLVPDQDPEEIVGRLRAHLDRTGLRGYTLRLFGGERAFQTDLRDPFVRLVMDAVREATGRELVLMPTSPGTGPMHDLGGPLGLPILSLGAGYWGCNAHAPDEHIRLADFQETVVMLAHLLDRFAR
ncbi:MAG: M20/M25/M40 family metallo-hydrolase [Armatimonadota bacterium]|nr:M20/M25/M40 family metallo-hydrolase [Armatimonadota bacterium]MDR7456181.1 M20/M25/M40 family metallo-hydrolase [Armatimonadota bacterium]